MSIDVLYSYRMSFYHVLPSNAATGTYPKNNAAEYTTPLDVPYQFNGDWEAAVTETVLIHSLQTTISN